MQVRARERAPDNHSNLIAAALVGELKYVSDLLFKHVASPWLAHPHRAPLPSTAMALTPGAAQEGGANWIDLR